MIIFMIYYLNSYKQNKYSEIVAFISDDEFRKYFEIKNKFKKLTLMI